MIKKLLKIPTTKLNQSQKPTQVETQQSLESQSINITSREHKQHKEVIYSYLSDSANIANSTTEKAMHTKGYTSSALTEQSTAYLTQSKLKTASKRKDKKASKISLKLKSPKPQPSMPVNQILNEIQERVVKPIRKQIHQRSNTSHQMNKTVDALKNNVSTATEELSQTVTSNNSLWQTSKVTASEIERIQLENYAIEKEIFEIIKEKDKLITERLRLENSTVLATNEYESLKEEVASMHQKSRLLAQMANESLHQKKVLISALMLIRKRIYELKEKVFRYERNDSSVQKELSLILDTFKAAD